MKILPVTLLFTLILISMTSSAQENPVPYREIPDYPERFTAGTMAARMIDGLGFRFYWATEGLREKDLVYRPNEVSRSSGETIDHILNMTQGIANAIKKESVASPENLNHTEKRKYVLNELKEISDLLRTSSAEEMETYTIALGNNESLPFWNFVNGQIADCIWHCGQISSFRRTTGNPISAEANFFRGTVRK